MVLFCSNLELVFLWQEVVDVLLDVGVGVEDRVPDALLDGGLQLGHPRNVLLLLKLFKHPHSEMFLRSGQVSGIAVLTGFSCNEVR